MSEKFKTKENNYMKTEVTLGTIIFIAGGSFLIGYKYGCAKTREKVVETTLEALTNILNAETENSKGE